MFIRPYVAPANLPEDVKIAVDNAENRISMLQAEEGRIINALGDSKNELLTLENELSGKHTSLKELNAACASTEAQKAKNEDTLLVQGIEIQKNADSIKVQKEEIETLKKEVTRERDNKSEAIKFNEEMRKKIDAELEVWTKRKETLETLYSAVKEIVSKI